jgi:glycosyltransferase involved in cell wall biosynthesis
MSVGFVEGMLPELMKRYEVTVLSSPGPELEDVHQRYGVGTIAVPMERHISLTRDFKSLMALVKVFRKEKPQMVHSMTPKAGLLCMMAAWLTRVPVRVHTFTGLVWPTERGLKRKILMATDWLTCACATHIIPEGEGVKNDLLSNGITKKPLKVLGYGNVRGVDMERFSRRPEVMEKAAQIAQSKQMFTFLFVGRIVGDKGINELVAAFCRLYNGYSGVRLLLVGFFEEDLDPVSDETKRAIDECAAIEAVGEKAGDELLAYYAAADCFVFPSYREGFPNTVLEAGAMGLPCIVTDINGSREIISLSPALPQREGEKLSVRDNGIVIPPKDEEALYAAMRQMMMDETGRRRMASNARKIIAERFEQGFVRKCLYEFYDEILKS